MQRDVGIDRGEPSGQGPYLLLRVIFSRHNQCGDLQMAAAGSQGDGAFHALQISSQGAVPPFGKALQINVYRVDQRQQLPPPVLCNGTIGHQHVEHPGLVYQRGAVPHILIANQRLIIGIGHTDIAPAGQTYSLLHQRLRCAIPGWKCLPCSSDLNILTEGTAQITAKAAHRQYHTAWMEPAQRLFLNGVQGQRGQLAIVERDNPSAPVASGPAQPGLSLR